jgi:hypothetical protein
MLCRVVFISTDVMEEFIATIIRVTRIGELRTMLAVTFNVSTLRRNTLAACFYYYFLLPLFLARWFLLPWRWRRYVPPKRWFLHKPHTFIGLLYQPWMTDGDDCGAVSGRGNRSTGKKPAPVPLYPPQTPAWLDPGSNLGRRGLTARATARPGKRYVWMFESKQRSASSHCCALRLGCLLIPTLI